MMGTCQGWHFMTTPTRFTLGDLSYYLLMKWHIPLPTQLFCNLWTSSNVSFEISTTMHLFYQPLLAILLSSLLFEFVPPQFDCCPWDISRGNLKEWLGQRASSSISTNNCPSWYWHLLEVLLSCISAMGGQGVCLPQKIQHLADVKCQSL